MLTILVNNVKSQIVGFLDRSVITALLEKLSYEDPNAFFMQQYSQFAGIHYLFTRGSQTFPTGLISYVEQVLQSKNVPYDFVDKRNMPNMEPELPHFGPTLRDYQEQAVNLAVQKQRGIVKIATGGGKSLVISRIAAKLNIPTLILTHKTDLLYQLQRNLQDDLHIEIGVVGDGLCDIKKFTIGTIQTISRVFEKAKKKKKKSKLPDPDAEIILTKAEQITQLIKNVQCLIVDECHHCPSDSFGIVQRQAENAFYRFGFSASPWREDNADLLIEAMNARKFIDIPASLLIEQGHLTQPITYLLNYKHEKKSRPETYPEIYDSEVVNSFARNKLVVESALKAAAANKTVLIAVTKIEHGKALEQMLQVIEPTALFVYGDSDSDIRQQVLIELNERRRKIVICTTIFGEGVDVPNLDVLINAKAAASSVDAFQLIGRVLRKTPQKKLAYVVDIFDQQCKYLGQHSKERLKIYQTEPLYILKDVSTVEELDFTQGAL